MSLGAIIVAVVLYLVHSVLPMDPRILDVVVILAVLLWLAQATGVLGVLDRPVRLR